MQEYFYSGSTDDSIKKISTALFSILKGEVPIIVCIGTDAIIGDSIGPIVGTMLERQRSDLFVYGSLTKTITAKEIKTIAKFLSKIHKSEKVLVIDAAIGSIEDVGKIKLSCAPIKPGLGAEKDLPALGDISIVPIVCERSKGNLAFSSTPRLSSIYNMSRIISAAIIRYVNEAKSSEVLEKTAN